MAVNLSVKDVPVELAKRLRSRATRAHRSLQGELLAILEESVSPKEALTPREVLKRVRALKLRTAAEGTRLIRAERNAR